MMRTESHWIETRRRGGVYVAVLSVSLLVTIIAIGGLAASRSLARGLDAGRHHLAARRLAESGVDMVRATMAREFNWRTERGSGRWLDKAPINQGVVTVDVNAGSDELDPAEVVATAMVGGSLHAYSVTMQAEQMTPDALSYGLFAGGRIGFSSAIVAGSSGLGIGANGSTLAAVSTIGPRVATGGTAGGATYLGGTATLQAARSMPDADQVFTEYVNRGTWIPLTALTGSVGVRTLENVLLSPTQNPFGSTNPDGIYILDAGGATVRIRNCRIIGTLVILAPGPGSEVDGEVTWEPVNQLDPALLVRGDFLIEIVDSNLREGRNGIGNLNPSGAPYPFPNGQFNTTITDQFASEIAGLVYVSGDLTIRNKARITAVIAGGNVAVEGVLTLAYDSILTSSPPAGFTRVLMRPLLGSAAPATADIDAVQAEGTE